jgi:hypothetical protein
MVGKTIPEVFIGKTSVVPFSPVPCAICPIICTIIMLINNEYSTKLF